MEYSIKSHPTMYNGVQYRSRLEARWAVLFDRIGWKHSYEPVDLPGWTPDFYVEFPCGHSECARTDGKRDGHHSLLIEVKPYFSVNDFRGHPCMNYPFGVRHGGSVFVSHDCRINADSSAAFGVNPNVTWWAMGHGAGGGDFSLVDWEGDLDQEWAEAGNAVQWRPNSR